MTFSNSDDCPALIPTPSPSSLATLSWPSTLGTKKGKNQDDESQQLRLQAPAGGWVFIPSVLFVTLLHCHFPPTPNTLTKMESISRTLCY